MRRRRVRDRPVLPSTRAVVGGLLLALAGVGTFVAWREAVGTPDTSYVVSRRTVLPGERLAAEDLRVVPLDLPSDLRTGAFATPDAVVGRVALGPIGAEELLQASQLGAAVPADDVGQVSFALPRDRALDGQLRSGDRVDLFVTYDDGTSRVAQGVQVVAAGSPDRPSLATDVEVTVTLALTAAIPRAELIHAVRAGDVTLVRTPPSPGGGDGTGPPSEPEAYSPQPAATGAP